MIIIGLCGGSGSGKGAVSKIFYEHGIPSIDTDAVYRELTVPGAQLLETLSSIFGNSVINSDGSLNRKKLSAIVFSDTEKHKLLNSVTHKAILEESEKIITSYKNDGYPGVIVDAPLLFESGFNKKCDIIIAVTAPPEIRIRRITARDSITAEAAKQRIASQHSDEFLIENSDYVIENDGDLNALSNKVNEIAKIILK